MDRWHLLSAASTSAFLSVSRHDSWQPLCLMDFLHASLSYLPECTLGGELSPTRAYLVGLS